jgi:predicted RNA-binding protein (TIGR00451 family)
MLPEGHVAVMNKCPAIDRMEEILSDGTIVATERFDLGVGWRVIIRMQGALRIAKVMSKGYVVLNPDAAPFVRENKNLMAPGVCDADPNIRIDDEVIMVLADRTVIGNTNPKWQGGFGLSGQWKDFDFTANFTYMLNFDVYNGTAYALSASSSNSQQYTNVLSEFTRDNRWIYTQDITSHDDYTTSSDLTIEAYREAING